MLIKLFTNSNLPISKKLFLHNKSIDFKQLNHVVNFLNEYSKKNVSTKEEKKMIKMKRGR